MKNFLFMLAAAPAILLQSSGAQALDVTVHQDLTHSKGAWIDEKGGTLETDSADGTHFKLTLPPGALLRSLPIRISPVVRAADGLPFAGGIDAGVVIEPEGTLLLTPATLEITLNKAPVNLVAYSHHEDGVGFEVYPVLPKGRVLTLPILHFSGGGVTPATQQELNSLAAASGSTAEATCGAQLTALVAVLMTEMDNNVTNPDFAKQASLDLMAWSIDLIKRIRVLLNASGDIDQSAVLQLIIESDHFGKLTELLGQNDGKPGAAYESQQRLLALLLQKLLEQVIHSCWDQSAKRTVPQIYSDSLAIARIAETHGFAVSDESVFGRMQDCLRFEVLVHSQMIYSSPKGPITSQLEGDFFVTNISPMGGSYAGEGQVWFAYANAPAGNGCTVSFSAAKRDARIQLMTITGDQPSDSHSQTPVRPGRPVAPPPPPMPSNTPSTPGSVNLVDFDFENPREKLVQNCSQVEPVSVGSFWFTNFTLAHQSEFTPAQGYEGFVIQDWTMGSAGVMQTLATKNYNGSGQAQFQETTQMEIKHSPLTPKPPIVIPANDTAAQVTQDFGLVKSDLSDTAAGHIKVPDMAASLSTWLTRAALVNDQGALDALIAQANQGMDSAFSARVSYLSSCGSVNSAKLWALAKWSQSSSLVQALPSYNLNTMIQTITNCMSVKLDFTSEYKTKSGSNLNFDSTVTAQGPLTSKLDLDSGIVTFSGTVPANHPVASGLPGGPCQVTVVGNADNISVPEGKMHLSVASGDAGAYLDSVDLDVGKPTETNTFEGCGPIPPVKTSMWLGMWNLFRGVDNVAEFNGESAIRFDAWPSDPFTASAKLTFSGSDPKGLNTEVSTKITLTLSPQQ